jgi:polyferredoxin
VFRPRVLVYGVVLLAIVAAFLTSLALRAPFRVDVVRDRNSLARQVEDGRVENVYRLQVMNATERPQRYEVHVVGLEQARVLARGQLELPPAGMRWWPVSVQLPYEAAQSLGTGVHKIAFEIHQLPADGRPEATVSERTTFMVPR